MKQYLCTPHIGGDHFPSRAAQGTRWSSAVIRGAPMHLDKTVYLSTAQAAQYLGVKPDHLRDLRSTGDGPSFTRIGKLVRYRREWLDLYAEGRVAASTIDGREPGHTRRAAARAGPG